MNDIRDLIAPRGLALLGAFSPEPADAVPALSDGSRAATLLLLGFAGGGHWPAVAAAAEAADGRPDALDRWSRRVVGDLAAALGAAALFPFDGPPWLPFQRWARRAGAFHPSPLGILIHPDWGLWHGFRGALALPQALELPPPDRRPGPCALCAARPCLSACPVGAFTGARYEVARCVDHLATVAGGDCNEAGCRARRACPVGAEYRYGGDQSRFHMRAFRAAH